MSQGPQLGLTFDSLIPSDAMQPRDSLVKPETLIRKDVIVNPGSSGFSLSVAVTLIPKTT